jgi:hypothetical protein
MEMLPAAANSHLLGEFVHFHTCFLDAAWLYASVLAHDA